jgi:hypothetical protein
MESDGQGAKPRKKGRKILARAVVTLLLLGATAICVLLFLKYREAVDTNPKNIEQKTVEEVAKLVETPDEKPSVVTVLDASKLSNAELAARAQDGDRLLVYAENRRVIMYRPSNGKIVDILTIKDVQDAVVAPAEGTEAEGTAANSTQ